MKKYFILILILFTSFLMTNQYSHSYHTLNQPSGATSFVFYNLPSMPVDFVIDGGTMGGENGLTIVQDACTEWNELDNIGDFCGTLNQLSEDITLANFNTIVENNDGIHNIVFDNTGLILSNLGFSPGVLGVGITTRNAAGTITDIRIILNGSIPQSNFFDYLGLTVHEMGHTWGLGHTGVGGINEANMDGLDPIDEEGIPTMYPLSFPTNDQFSRTLELDDFSSALLLYGP